MKYLEEIEAYLNNDLSETDRIDFENQCQTDEVLASELAFYLQTKQAFKTHRQEQFKQRYNTESTNSQPIIRKIAWITASAAAIVLLLWFGLPLFNDYQTEQQLAQVETPIFFLNNQITRSNDTLTRNQRIWQNAFVATKNKDYETAIQLAVNLNTKEALGLQAFCHFELKNYEDAALLYEFYLEENPPYYERLRSQWNLALTYRILGKTAKEKQELEFIGQEGRKDLLKILK